MEPILIFTLIGLIGSVIILVWQLSYIKIGPWRKLKNTDQYCENCKKIKDGETSVS